MRDSARIYSAEQRVTSVAALLEVLCPDAAVPRGLPFAYGAPEAADDRAGPVHLWDAYARSEVVDTARRSPLRAGPAQGADGPHRARVRSGCASVPARDRRQDADIVRYLERFAEEPPVPSRAHDDAEDTARSWARRAIRRRSRPKRNLVTWTFVVETMGLEPTTPCLQSRIVTTSHLPSIGRSAGQQRFALSARTAR